MTNDTDLRAAVAHIKRFKLTTDKWKAKDFTSHPAFCAELATILNAVASGDLVPRADVDGLVGAAKWLRATAQSGFRTADFHRGECSCPRCAEDALFVALTALENRNDR